MVKYFVSDNLLTASLYPEVRETLDILSQFGNPRMSGSGSAVVPAAKIRSSTAKANGAGKQPLAPIDGATGNAAAGAGAKRAAAAQKQRHPYYW